MKQVDLQEFQKHALKYLIGDEEVAVELNGRVLGRYVPDLQERKQAREAMQRFEAILEKIMAETGETEEELSDFFNPKKPLPPEYAGEEPDPQILRQLNERVKPLIERVRSRH